MPEAAWLLSMVLVLAPLKRLVAYGHSVECRPSVEPKETSWWALYYLIAL
jgi:hypothetical protein